MCFISGPSKGRQSQNPFRYQHQSELLKIKERKIFFFFCFILVLFRDIQVLTHVYFIKETKHDPI